MPQLSVDRRGVVTFIYRDDLRQVLAEGAARIIRASHVEPDEQGRWVADLSPVGGPSLGPFTLRQEALAAEAAWLEDHVL